jgi:Domain of unknown function (DUF4145)
MPPKFETPSISKKSFNCPRCGAFADQFWCQIYARDIAREKDDKNLPFLVTTEWVKRIEKEQQNYRDKDMITPPNVLRIWRRNATGDLTVGDHHENHYSLTVDNLHLSRCRSCNDVSLWLYDKVIFPNVKFEIEPNSDLSDEIKQDFNEARDVLPFSARAAAALLRLCIQKLCIQLGLPGENINSDIAELVRRGVSPKIQKSLDIVRVIGNESVHPGTIDLRDNRDTAEVLFKLVNQIAYDVITHPKELEEVYASLPEEKRQAIEKRDATK